MACAKGFNTLLSSGTTLRQTELIYKGTDCFNLLTYGIKQSKRTIGSKRQRDAGESTTCTHIKNSTDRRFFYIGKKGKRIKNMKNERVM